MAAKSAAISPNLFRLKARGFRHPRWDTKPTPHYLYRSQTQLTSDFVDINQYREFLSILNHQLFGILNTLCPAFKPVLAHRFSRAEVLHSYRSRLLEAHRGNARCLDELAPAFTILPTHQRVPGDE